jgi:DNA polymerase
MAYPFRRLHLDFETRSEANIKKVGSQHYAAHPSTRILMLGWAIDDDPVNLWQPHLEPIPYDLKETIPDPAFRKHAFNAQFERLITRYCLDVDVPYDHWRCTMVEAYYLGFAGKLDQILEAVGLEKKDPRGQQLINLFSTPAPKNHRADWYDWDNRPNEWLEFCLYCIKDVKVERQLWHWLHKFPAMNDWDWGQYFTDQRINDRGAPMDVATAQAAIEVWGGEKERLTEQLKKVTGLPKVTRDPFKAYMTQRFGVKLPDLRKDTLETMLRKGDLPEEAKAPISLWIQKEAKSTSKYQAVINATMPDGRARGMFQYKGASRTDRVGGRIIQLQNLKRPFTKPVAEKIEQVVDDIKTGSATMLHMLYPLKVSEVLGGSIRHVLHAKPGHTFAAADLTSIESVVLGWVSMCPAIDATYRAGRDAYKVFASKYYGIPYEEVTKEQRNFAKPPVLGCGFMLGWKGLIAYAEGYGVEMTREQAERAVKTFREMYPEIPDFWKWIYDAVKYTTTTYQPCEGYRLRIERDEDFLRIWLPSGRALSYYKPEIIKRPAPWDSSKLIDNFSYMGMNDKNQWCRITAHAGGVTENVVQSLAGDVLWNGITNAEATGQLPVTMHVHDEVVAEVPVGIADRMVALLEECLTRNPWWCPDMWLGATGFHLPRYTKD